MLKVLTGEAKPTNEYTSKPISKSMIIAFGKTPSQNSFLELLPLKSHARVKNNLKAVNIVIHNNCLNLKKVYLK